VSGRQKPGGGDEASQLRDLLREAHGAIKDLRSELRESHRLFDAVMRSRAEFFKRVEEEVVRERELLLAAVGVRQAELMKAIGELLPVNISCPVCHAVSTFSVDVLASGKQKLPCKKCGVITTYVTEIQSDGVANG
jgi:hypothetical protein